MMNGQIDTQPQSEIVWRPQAGPQKALVDCSVPEVFFDGARGGGKTDGVLGKWALKERRFGSNFNAVGFRRTSVSFEDAIDRAKQIYVPLGAKFADRPARFKMPHGGRVSFSYLENTDDAQEYQGRNITDAWVEEAGQYAFSDPIDRLFGTLRSSSGVPVQLILTANPGGPGQHWLRERYKLWPFPAGPKLYKRLLPNGDVHSVAVIPSRITDNKVLLASDPGYVGRLHLVGSDALVKAWLNGDWSAVEGAFFTEWSEAELHRRATKPK
jgi:Phage terminase large subunit